MSPHPHRSNATQVRRPRLLRWGVVFLLILAVATTAVVVLTRGVSWRDRAPITQAVLLEQGVLALVVDTCGAEPELDLLDEQEEAVEVAVVSTRTIHR